ncbi:MAG: hypothetical protein ACRDIB_06315, partial [Ardenticatenaceae bacterium]
SGDAALRDVLQPDHPMDVPFGDALRLLGWESSDAPSPADEGVPLMVYWMAQRSLQADYKVRLDVVDEEGFVYGTVEQRPTSYYYPTFRWTPGEPRLATMTIPLQPGTPPGEYWVRLSVYPEDTLSSLDILDEVGAPQGQEVQLGPVMVAPPAFGWFGAGAPSTATPVNQTLLGGHELVASRLALPVQLQPGQRVPLTLWWRVDGPLPGATLHLGWERGSTLVGEEQYAPGAPAWSGDKWRPGDFLMTPLIASVPRTIEPGLTRLVAWLSDASGQESRRVTLASGNVVEANRSFDPPAVTTPQQADFGEKIRLLGYDLSEQEFTPGEPVTLTLYWEALSEMEESYTVFAHLLTASGAIIAEGGEDKLPDDGARLTDSWIGGEYLADTFRLALPSDPPPPPYRIEVGWYDANDPGFPRLPATGTGAERNRVILSTRLNR